uniref:Uncharacterized protein n=1 Tax=Anopheles melas TaxID=34690 RepID=A0A182TDM4_9DIPT
MPSLFFLSCTPSANKRTRSAVNYIFDEKYYLFNFSTPDRFSIVFSEIHTQLTRDDDRDRYSESAESLTSSAIDWPATGWAVLLVTVMVELLVLVASGWVLLAVDASLLLPLSAAMEAWISGGWFVRVTTMVVLNVKTAIITRY